MEALAPFTLISVKITVRLSRSDPVDDEAGDPEAGKIVGHVVLELNGA